MGCTNSSNTKEPRKPQRKKSGATTAIKRKYKIETKILGSGAFGKVFLASSIQDHNFKVAIKVIPKKKIEGDIAQLHAEIEVLKTLDHPNIIKYYETFENAKYLYIVMEYCPGGELFDVIANKANKDRCFNESEAASIVKNILKAINHCHSLNIAHRDIKPENIMIGDEGELKLIDFGLSKQIKNKKMKSIVGTPYYVAPEVLEGKYGTKCDIWSIGVLLYILLSGYMPFGGSDANEVFKKVQEGKYYFTQKEWEKVSPEGIDLIKHMLQTDTKKRYSAEQCLKHDWFVVAKEMKNDIEKDPLDPNILQNLMKYKASSALKKAAMNIFVKILNQKEITTLREQFEALDTNQSGRVDIDELAKALRRSDVDIPDAKVEAIIKEIDSAGNRHINYSEFLVATVSARNLLNENRLYMLFKEFDTDDTEYITADNLKEAFERLEKPISKSEIAHIMKAHDIEKDGKISYEEFKQMMLEDVDEPVIELKSDFALKPTTT